MASMWSRWGKVKSTKCMQGGDTYDAPTDFVDKCHVAKAIQAITFGFLPLGEHVPLRILRALVKKGRETLYTISNCKKHG